MSNIRRGSLAKPMKGLVSTLAFGTSVLGATSATAAPMMDATTLPFSDRDAAELASVYGYTEDRIQEFLQVLWGLEVFEDHANTKDPAQRHDRNITKTFYGVPYLTPSRARSVVGSQQFADYALEVIDAVDRLARSFSLKLRELERLNLELEDKRHLKNDMELGRLNALTGHGKGDPQTLSELIDAVDAEITELEQERAEVLAEGGDGLDQVGLTLRQEIVDDLIWQMSRIGVTPTQAEQEQLMSPDHTQMMLGMGSLRARAANGQLGLRQVIMESGLDEDQRDILALYRTMRPDVQLRALNIRQLYAQAAGQTLLDQSGRVIENPPPIILRAVNGSSKGSCGAAHTCNVVLEYTSIGARAARMAKLGAVVIPVTFQADVNVAVPDFVGHVSCDYSTGWTARGRADVRDGGIIYDGDLTNRIRFGSSENGNCIVSIDEGSKDSAEYALLTELFRQYDTTRVERGQRSLADRRDYAGHVRAELVRHSEQSQQPRGGGWFSDVLGFFTGGLSHLFDWAIVEGPEFYWHTRIEDTADEHHVHIDTRIELRNTTRMESRAFDGRPLVCFEKASPESIESAMVACPDAMVPGRTTESEVAEQNCPEGDEYNRCITRVDSAPPNEEGYAENPF